MNWRKLVIIGGFVAIAVLAFRRSTRRDATEIGIDDADTGRQATEQEVSVGEATADGATGVELESIEGVGPAYAERLREAGVADGADLVDADPEDLAAETEIGERRIRRWVERVRDRDDR